MSVVRGHQPVSLIWILTRYLNSVINNINPQQGSILFPNWYFYVPQRSGGGGAKWMIKSSFSNNIQKSSSVEGYLSGFLLLGGILTLTHPTPHTGDSLSLWARYVEPGQGQTSYVFIIAMDNCGTDVASKGSRIGTAENVMIVQLDPLVQVNSEYQCHSRQYSIKMSSKPPCQILM